MNTTTEAPNTPRVTSPPRPDRREALRREEERLHELRVIGERALLVPYEQGEAVLRVRESKVHEIAEGGYGKAEDYVGARLELSAKTLHRRVVMVEVYEEDEYLALLAAGVSLTTIERLAAADPEVRAALQALAVEIQDDLAVTDALRAWTRAKKKEDEARSEEGLVKLLAQAAQQSILERLEAQAARRASKEAQAERRQSGRASPTEELRERLEQERRELEQQRREQAVLALQLKEQQAALAVEVQRLERLRAEVELGGGTGAAVGGAAAEVQRLQEALAAAQAQAAQARAEAQAAQARVEAQAAQARVEAQAAQARAEAQAAQAAQADKRSAGPGDLSPDNLSADRGSGTKDNLSADALAQRAAALEHKAVLLWEQEQRLLRKEASFRSAPPPRRSRRPPWPASTPSC